MRDAVSLFLAAMRAMHLHFAEIGREGELLLAGQRLFRKYDNMMREKRFPDRVLHCTGQWG